ncbi:hypothetical protein EVAR_9661_1 [Eumeta japonica]|uniref:Uncharacterized protein n=1 Tax=Eumeta variegata TaxID=151549 RepID=A0A4C1TMX9_EUMVA|nr:hypothetical protein EVAR_9661_1 [Eumeta japonica]
MPFRTPRSRCRLSRRSHRVCDLICIFCTGIHCHFPEKRILDYETPKERIKVVFEEISLQKGDVSCLSRADIIKVFDGRDPSAPAIALLCNELTGTVYASEVH